jgi:hypothetical protein
MRCTKSTEFWGNSNVIDQPRYFEPRDRDSKHRLNSVVETLKEIVPARVLLAAPTIILALALVCAHWAIVITTHDREEDIRYTVRAGAKGYLVKTASYCAGIRSN